MTNSSSSQISSKYNLDLPTDVSDWFDNGFWELGTSFRFSEPVSPSELLATGAGVVWGGQMLPDTLPVLGNGCGDALCLRIGRYGELLEIVCWWHEGATWEPFGKTFPEALLYDAAMMLVESDEREDLACDPEFQRLVQWALSWTNLQENTVAELTSKLGTATQSVFDLLLNENISQIQIHRDRCCSSLATQLLTHCQSLGGQTLADDLGVEWPIISTWIFDTGLVPDEAKEMLSRATGVPSSELFNQDWKAAKQEAEIVAAMRSDIAWPFAVLGWAAEREGDVTTAAHWYQTGLRSMATTVDFTISWLPLTGVVSTKFVVERLLENSSLISDNIKNDDYFQAIGGCRTSAEIAESIREYWHELGSTAEDESRPFDAYRDYYNAGWDVYAYDYTKELLEKMVKNARLAGSDSLASLAELHLENTD